MGSFESNLADRFKPGSKVDVLPRLGDQPRGDAVKRTTVKDNGDVAVSGLIDNAPYWLTDGDKAVAFVAKTDELRGMDVMERAGRRETNWQTQAQREGRAKLHRAELASAAPGKSTSTNIVTGARSSRAKQQLANDPEVQPEVREQLENRQTVEPAPRPAPNQMDVSGVLQRSDTPLGAATPKEKDEIVPSPSQDDVKGLQRSDTEFGQAAPKDRSEVEPALSQEDAPKGLVQSSDTELGSVEPKGVQSKAKGKGAVKSAVEAKKTQQSSGAKVSGESVKPAAKTGSKRSPAERVKGKSPAKQSKDQ